MPQPQYLQDKVRNWDEEAGNKGTTRKSCVRCDSRGSKEGEGFNIKIPLPKGWANGGNHPLKRQRGMIVDKPILVRQAEQRDQDQGWADMIRKTPTLIQVPTGPPFQCCWEAQPGQKDNPTGVRPRVEPQQYKGKG